MEVRIDNEKRMVTVWLTREDSLNTNIQRRLDGIYSEFKPLRYVVGVFYSGEKDLFEHTKNLLLRNRK